MPSHTTSRLALAASAVVVPFLGILAVSAMAGGCGPDKPLPKPPVPSASVDAAPPPDAAPVDAAPPDLGTPLVVDAGAADVVAAADVSDAPAPPCWKGFAPTGNATADLLDLAGRCTVGMSPLLNPPVKQAFKQGEVKTIPIPFVPGCYRIIAVGGTGLKDVDLELKNQAGGMVAADNTPNDVYPMIHPNKEFCIDALQILNLSIIVKKGTGEVAGGVWKR